MSAAVDWAALGRSAGAAVAGALIVVVAFSVVVVGSARVEVPGRRRPLDVALIATGLIVCAAAVGLGLWAMAQK